MSEFWDEFQAADEYVKFEAHGQAVVGTIISVGVKEWDDGSRSPQVFIEDAEGGTVCVTASQVMLKKALAEAKPRPGDRIRVTYTGDGEAKPGRTAAKLFTVEVQRGEGVPAAAAAPVAASVPSASAGDPF